MPTSHQDRLLHEQSDAVEIIAHTDTGRQRSRNEDSFYVLSRGSLAVVADGMGGHADGNIASSTAVTTICELVEDKAGPPPFDAREAQFEWLRGMVDEANARIFGKNRGYFSVEGMGTTLVMLHLTPRHAITVCVGDSRIYRYRAGKLRQLTQDHSLFEELRRFNLFGGRSAHALNINKNIITRALGMNSSVNADIEVFPRKDGDIYLLCSDGLTDLVEDDEIAAILQKSHGDLEKASFELVATANANGGTDNITVVLARRVDPSTGS